MCIDKDAKIQELEAKLKDFLSAQHYRYIGKSGIPVMARELENSRDEWERKAKVAIRALMEISDQAADCNLHNIQVTASEAIIEINGHVF